MVVEAAGWSLKGHERASPGRLGSPGPAASFLVLVRLFYCGDDFDSESRWPSVIWAEGEYHMFLSYIAGTPEQWAGHERHIVHFVSDDLTQWRRIGPLRLSSNYVIDGGLIKTM